MTDRTVPLGGAANEVHATGLHGRWETIPRDRRPDVAAIGVLTQREALTAAWGHAAAGSLETLITTRGQLDEWQRAQLRADGFALDGAAPECPRPPAPGRVWLLTSGSTGRPKRVAHTIDSLLTMRGERPARRWLLPYSPGTYGWWQFVGMALTMPGQDLVAVDADELAQWPRIALEHGVDAIAGTPTFWRAALLRDSVRLRALPLTQVTLGGEPIGQDLLDALREVFPDAQLTWAYGSTETGIALTVSDGRAGFPAAWLERANSGRPQLRIQGDELLVRTAYAAGNLTARDNAGDGFWHTGDRVERVGDRIHITGRLDGDEINVGGAKVSASAVRRVLTAHPDVFWAAVRAQPAPLVGQLVAADVVATPGSAIDIDAVTAWCARRLPRHAVPRLIQALETVPMRENLKAQ
ncbi:ANL family adenylate-forming protein [Nocardia terpenica]|uniref:AMP-binding protein n=1 Tax=Nocardia terpenica TaxID=455432 RepID=A0A6G9Z4G1_9NOCA|nr:fatty acid--CoA ligase family protein [Nocardia terpenica]QIS20237.1 AMP-binding protein [Nocardia terpenica]